MPPSIRAASSPAGRRHQHVAAASRPAGPSARSAAVSSPWSASSAARSHSRLDRRTDRSGVRRPPRSGYSVLSPDSSRSRSSSNSAQASSPVDAHLLEQWSVVGRVPVQLAHLVGMRAHGQGRELGLGHDRDARRCDRGPAAANWLLSSVVTQPVSWVSTTSGLASSFITSILRRVANERVKSRWTRMCRKPKPQQSNQVRVVAHLGAQRRPPRRSRSAVRWPP